MTMLQNYIMSFQNSILMNTRFFQMLKKALGKKYNRNNLYTEANNVWFKNEESADATIKNSEEESADLSFISPLGTNEEIKEEK